MQISLQAVHHYAETTDSPSPRQLLWVQHQQAQSAGTLQRCSPASTTSVWEELKLSSHLEKTGESPMSRKGWCFRLWWAISRQCLTAGGHQSVGRPSAQQLWRFTAHSTGSEEQRTLPPPGGHETSSHSYDQSLLLLLARGDSEWNSALTYFSSMLLLLEEECLLCSLHVFIHQVFQLLLQLHSHRIWSGRKAKGRMWWGQNLWV